MTTLFVATPTVKPLARRPARVLVVDAIPELAQLHRFVLTRAGYETMAVGDPTAVAERLSIFRPDAVMMRCGRRLCECSQLVSVLRASPAFGQRPVALIASPGVDRSVFASFDVQAIEFSPVLPSRLRELLLACGIGPTIAE